MNNYIYIYIYIYIQIEKAEQRLKWLSRALQRCEDGAVPAAKICYDSYSFNSLLIS